MHWQAGGGRAASVLAPSPRSPHRGPQPWLEEELDPSTLARFDHEDPTMVAAATRLQARAVTHDSRFPPNPHFSAACCDRSVHGEYDGRGFCGTTRWSLRQHAPNDRRAPLRGAWHSFSCAHLSYCAAFTGADRLGKTKNHRRSKAIAFACAACSQTPERGDRRGWLSHVMSSLSQLLPLSCAECSPSIAARRFTLSLGAVVFDD